MNAQTVTGASANAAATDPASEPESKQTWRKGLPHEAAFWKKQLIDGDPRWPGLQAERAKPGRPLGQALRQLIVPEPPVGALVRILDVGSGPLTVLGSLWEGRRLEVVPTDPLADEYNAWIDESGLNPPFRPRRVEAEKVLEAFGPESFDMAFSHNALDHCYDPLLAIDQMLAVTRRGQCVRLEHVPNEGKREDYVGLHQWNFDAENGHFIIWNPAMRVDVTERLRASATVECHSRPDWLTVTIRRHASA